jgi:hypothetical protein
MRSPCSVCVCASPHIKFRMSEQSFMKPGIYIMVPEPILTMYFINPTNQSVCLYLYPSIVALQRFGKNVTAATNTHVTIEELLDALFSIWSVSYQKKIGD